MEPRQTDADLPPTSGGSSTRRARDAPFDRRKACITCRSRKMRCNGERPRCRPCLDFGRLCEYSTEEPKPSGPKSAAILTVHLAELEERLQHMLSVQPDRHTARESTSSTVSPSQTSVTSDAGHGLQSTGFSTPRNSEIEFSPEDRDNIFAIYFKYQYRLAGTIDPSYITQGLEAQDENLQPHPALLDGLLLMGIMLGHLTKQSHLLPAVLPDTNQFLFQIHRKLATSIEQVDRLFDHLQASLLLCSWYFYNCRLQEAQYFSALNFRLAVAYQLHKIDGNILREDLSDASYPSFWDNTILGRPRSRRHLYTRILCFWFCYSSERLINLVTGLPTASDDLTITTLWPRALEEFELEDVIAPQDLYSIQELFSGKSGQSSYGSKMIFSEKWKMLALLGRATQLAAITETLDPYDTPTLEDVIQKINVFVNAVQVYDSTLPNLDRYLPPHQSIKSSPQGTAWCIALQSQMGTCAVHVHLLRSIEAIQAVLASLANSDVAPPAGINPHIYAAFAPLLPKDGQAFLDLRFSFAQSGIRLTYEAARQHVEDDPLGFASEKWLTHLPNFCGFMLPSLLLPVVESIHDVEARIRALPSAEMAAHQTLSAFLEDAETTFTQGMQVMNLLSVNMSVLKLQMDKLELARYPIS